MPKLSDATMAHRRDEILDAAVRSLARFGYAGTSTRTIAEAGGFTKGGLYAYFANKEAIMLGVAERYLARQLEGLRAAEGATPRARLLAFLRRRPAKGERGTLQATQRAILDLWNAASSLPDVRRALLSRYRRYCAIIAGIIREGQVDGSFAAEVDANELAALVLAARDGLVLHRVRLGVHLPVDAMTELLIEVVTGSLARPPHRARRRP